MTYSCGIIPFRENDNGELEFFVGHPGGNYPNQENYWAFLKGSVEGNETWEEAALREFKEETGLTMEDCESGMLIPLGTTQQNPRKVVVAYAIHYPNIDPSKCYSNLSEDGVTVEIDKYQWMTFDQLRRVTHHTHLKFYEDLINRYLYEY